VLLLSQLNVCRFNQLLLVLRGIMVCLAGCLRLYKSEKICDVKDLWSVFEILDGLVEDEQLVRSLMK
jgi:hypothetical protein